MIDVDTVHSPGWWMKRCSDKLQRNRKRIDPLYARFEGNAPLPASVKSAPQAAQAFWKTSRTTLAEMLVKAVRYRMRISGWITEDAPDDVGDLAAMALWISSGAAAEQHDVNRNLLVSGDGYMMSAEYQGKPAATSEDPRQVVTIHDPVRQSELRAAAKFFHDDDYDTDYAYLFLPSGDGKTCRRFVAKRPRRTSTRATPRFSGSWEWDEQFGGAAGEEVPSEIPIVRYRNEEGVGEFERHLDILDRIDHLVLQGMVIATLQAFKQRAIKVDDKDMPEKDPKTGQTIDYNDVFTADPGALWKLPLTAEMWESGAVDMTPITTMATKELERLSAVTFTPLSMFTPEAANQSATGASLVKEGMTSKVEDRQDRLNDPYSRSLSLLGRIAKIAALDDPAKIRPRWAPAERFTLTEKAAAAQAAVLSGMPWAGRMRHVWQMDPQEIARMASERAADLLSDALARAAAAPAPAQTPAA